MFDRWKRALERLPQHPFAPLFAHAHAHTHVILPVPAPLPPSLQPAQLLPRGGAAGAYKLREPPGLEPLRARAAERQRGLRAGRGAPTRHHLPSVPCLRLVCHLLLQSTCKNYGELVDCSSLLPVPCRHNFCLSWYHLTTCHPCLWSAGGCPPRAPPSNYGLMRCLPPTFRRSPVLPLCCQLLWNAPDSEFHPGELPPDQQFTPVAPGKKPCSRQVHPPLIFRMPSVLPLW